MIFSPEKLRSPPELDHLIRILGIGCARSGTSFVAENLRRAGVVDAGLKEHHFYDSLFKMGFNGRIGWESTVFGHKEPVAPKGEFSREVRSIRARMLEEPHLYWEQYLYYTQRPSSPCAHIMDYTPGYGLLKPEHLRLAIEAHPQTRTLILLRDPIRRFWSGLKKAARDSGREVECLLQNEYYNLESPTGEAGIQFRKSQMGALLENALKAADPASIFIGFHEHLFGPERPGVLEQLSDFIQMPTGRLDSSFDTRVNCSDERPPPSDLVKRVAPFFEGEYELCARLLSGRTALPATWTL